MRRLLKALTACVSVAAIFVIFVYLFGAGKMRLDPTPVITSFARSIDVGILQEITPEGEDAEMMTEEQEVTQSFQLMPYAQQESLFRNDMDLQYAYLLIQQGLERSHLKDNALLMLENGNEFVIRCWSPGMSLELTEALADNKTRLEAWQDAVDSLWNLDAILSRDIKETLGTDKSVTIQIVDDVHPEAVLLKIKDGKIEYNLMRDGTAPNYEVYGKN